MSESDRMPGYRKRSQVPPIDSRASRITQRLPGASICRWQAAPTPERPAPTISTSTCSVFMWAPVVMRQRSQHTSAARRPSRYQRRVGRVNTVSTVSTCCKLACMSSVTQTSAGRSSRGRRAPRANGDDRERAILETAERLLAERSLHDISVDDLARGAGISRPTFYFYFPSKEAVLLTLLDRVVNEADSALQALAENDDADRDNMWRTGINVF